jgi:UDP-N-acetylmuramyl pentapeptide phosphotransferase/UDP-N-acetylglucosamine-1-phosphate transferase
MNSLLVALLSILLIISLNFFFYKYKFLLDKKKLSHKSFSSNDTVPLTGGVVIIFNLLIFSNSYLVIFFFLIFFLGVFSDLFLISSALKKFLIQFLIIFLFVYFLDLRILYTKISFLDYFLKYKVFALLFSCFCLLILINGTNFIDGINTLACGYYILILLAVMYIGEKNKLFYNFDDFYYLFLTLITIFIFNAFSKIYLGDSGSFLLSFVTGYYLISLFNNNLELKEPISSVFIILLLWYPAFENLFSIIRKTINKMHPSRPDNSHFHHLLFDFLKKKIKININFLNTITGIIINFYNLLIFFLGSQFYSQSKYLAYLVFFNVAFYLGVYFFLRSKIRK